MCRYPLFLTTFLFATVATLSATEDVISVTTSTTTGAPSSSEGYTFNNDQQSITSMTTASGTYAVASAADNVFVRRNAVNSNQSSVWYTTSGVGTDISGAHQDNYAQMLLSNNVLAGTDNIFANGTTSTTGNIERVDFTWNTPMAVNSGLAFAVFDRGTVGVHDAFAIAAVKGVDASGNPTAFGSVVIVAAGWGGGTNAIADFGYRLFRYGNGDNITVTTDSSGIATQGLGGVLIKATDLGLTLGQNIYGYALMASDVTASNSAEVLDWTNATFFPTNTDGNTGGNGLDLAAINGVAFSIVPEAVPSAALLGTFILLVSICQRKWRGGAAS
jgi:hypothetical protein